MIIQIAPSEIMLQAESTSIDQAAAHLIETVKDREEEEEESDCELNLLCDVPGVKRCDEKRRKRRSDGDNDASYLELIRS